MWTLLLSRIGDQPNTYVDRRQFDGGEMKIGRNARTCDWVLPDEQGHLSREHCTISAAGLDLFVIDTSTNGVALNAPGQRIAPQVPVAIRVKDRLLLGDFAIEIATENATAGISLAPPPPAPLPGGGSAGFAGMNQPDAWFAPTSDPIWGFDRAVEVHEFLGNAMHDFLAPSPASGGSGPPIDPAWGGPMADAFSKPIMAEIKPVAADFGIPEDWAAPPAATPIRATAPVADPFAAAYGDPFAGAATPPRAHDPFGGPAPAAFATPLSDPFAGAFGGDPGKAPSLTDDPFALPPAPDFGAPPAADPFAPPTEKAARFAGTPAVAAPAELRTPRSAGPAAAADWEAFCEGAGIDPADLRLGHDAMRRLGVLYRQVVLGMSDLIQDRAAFKDEFRVERTQLSMGKNNPLKHLPPLDSAKLLLGESLPGFMSSEDAVRTAFQDIKNHQLAMLAGVQHALNTVFERLSPGQIEKLMEKAASSRRGLPFSRGINPWTVYRTVFEALRSDAVSNANSVMSVAFRDGYEQFLKGGK